MCSCDEPSVCHTVIRTARKEHRCCEGNHRIAPGERYAYTSGVWDGRGASFKQCLTCRALFDAMLREDECGTCFGQLAESVEWWIRETYGWRRAA